MKTEFYKDGSSIVNRKDGGDAVGLSTMRDGSRFMLEMDNWVKWREHLVAYFKRSNDVYTLLTSGRSPVFDLPNMVEPVMYGEGELRRQSLNAAGALVWRTNPIYDRPDGELLYREQRKEMKDRMQKFNEIDLPKLMSILSVHVGITVHNKVTSMPEYDTKYRDNDACWIMEALEFVATGRGAHTVHMSSVSILKMKPLGTDQASIAAYFKEFIEERRKLKACGTAETVLNAMIDSAFIMSMRGVPALSKEMDEIWKSDQWPNTDDCIDKWMKILTVKAALSPTPEDETGKLVAHSANMNMKERISWVEDTQSQIANMQRQLAKVSFDDPVAYAVATGGSGIGKKKIGVGKGKSAERLCFNCMSKDHLYADCPEIKVTCSVCKKQHHTKVHDTVEKLKAAMQRGKKVKKRASTQHQTYISDETEDDDYVDPMMEGYNSMLGYHTMKQLELYRAEADGYDVDADHDENNLESDVFGNVLEMEDSYDSNWIHAHQALNAQKRAEQSVRQNQKDNIRRKNGPFWLSDEEEN